MADAPIEDNEVELKVLEACSFKPRRIEKETVSSFKPNEKGLSRHRIAKVLKISQPAVSGIIKREKIVIIITWHLSFLSFY
jgi:DNA-directed RNA polymerase specialized sigma subunit